MKRRISHVIAEARSVCRPSTWLLSSAVGLVALSAAAQSSPAQSTPEGTAPTISSSPPAVWGQLPASLSVPPTLSLPIVPSLRLTAPELLVSSPGQAQGDTLPG